MTLDAAPPHGDGTLPRNPDHPAPHHHGVNPWLVLTIVCLAQFMVVLDATVVNIALPSIKEDLGFSSASLQWIVTAYTLIFGGFLLLGGRAADLLGRKRLFIAGVVLFSGASLVNGLATTSTMLIIARGAQGLGGALVSPAALSIITSTFADGPERTKALGVWGGIAAGGAAVGLLLGGVLTQYLSWRWAFYVNVPVGIFTILAAVRIVPESRADLDHRSFDALGAITVTGGLITLVYAIEKGKDWGWSSTHTIAMFALSALLLIGFVLIELRQKAPLVRLSIFRMRSLVVANATMLLVGSGMFAMFYFASLYLQVVLGYSPLKAGLAFLPVSAGIMVAAGISTGIVPRLGVRVVSVIGLSLATAGMVMLTRLTAHSNYSDVLAGLMPIAVGMGFTFVPMTLVATTNVDENDSGLASGIFNTSQQLGGALGLAVLSTIAANTIDPALRKLALAAKAAPHVPMTPAQQDAAKAAGVAATNRILVHGWNHAYVGASILLGTALVVFVAFIRRSDLTAIEEADTISMPIG